MRALGTQPARAECAGALKPPPAASRALRPRKHLHGMGVLAAGRRRRASGAMYAGVPTVDLGCESNTADLLYPKSQIFSRGACRPSSSVFSSFRSRWHTPCARAAAPRRRRRSTDWGVGPS